MQVTQEQLYRLGGELQRIVDMGSFQLAVDIVKDQYANDFLHSNPEDKEGRERTYRQSKALDDLIGTINSLAQAAEREQQRRDQTETE